MDIAAQTDIGRRKKNNEDCYGVFREDTPGLRLFDEGALLCVADGLGGHVGGEIASKLAVSVMKDIIKEQWPDPPDDPEEPDPAVLPIMINGTVNANQAICQTNLDLVKGNKPMGTTFLSAIVTPKKVYLSNVGDSRCYHIRDGEIIDKTEDHSWVDEQVKLGMMSRAEAEVDHRRNFVTRSVGTHAEVEVDTYVWHIVPGDWLLLCTDGLVNMVKDTEIVGEFRKHSPSAEIAHRLITLANENGGKDNTTVIVANISPSFLRLIVMRSRSFFGKHGGVLIWIGSAILYGLTCFAAGFFGKDTIKALILKYFK